MVLCIGFNFIHPPYFPERRTDCFILGRYRVGFMFPLIFQPPRFHPNSTFYSTYSQKKSNNSGKIFKCPCYISMFLNKLILRTPILNTRAHGRHLLCLAPWQQGIQKTWLVSARLSEKCALDLNKVLQLNRSSRYAPAYSFSLNLNLSRIWGNTVYFTYICKTWLILILFSFFAECMSTKFEVNPSQF